jgi:hypothetical protein
MLAVAVALKNGEMRYDVTTRGAQTWFRSLTIEI